MRGEDLKHLVGKNVSFFCRELNDEVKHRFGLLTRVTDTAMFVSWQGEEQVYDLTTVLKVWVRPERVEGDNGRYEK